MGAPSESTTICTWHRQKIGEDTPEQAKDIGQDAESGSTVHEPEKQQRQELEVTLQVSSPENPLTVLFTSQHSNFFTRIVAIF